jgi:hypothetical protein
MTGGIATARPFKKKHAIIRVILTMKIPGTSEVNLAPRATPYDFLVRVTCNERSLTLYKGRSHASACGSYWQAVDMLGFVRSSGKVEMDLAKDRSEFGAFTTEVEYGTPKSLHVPSGKCAEWASKPWSQATIVEKKIATIPGMIAPLDHTR